MIMKKKKKKDCLILWIWHDVAYGWLNGISSNVKKRKRKKKEFRLWKGE
jgi:hypothetical protein